MMRREDIRLSSGTGERIACRAVALRRREVREQFRGRLFSQDSRTFTLPSPLERKRRWALAARCGARVQRING